MQQLWLAAGPETNLLWCRCPRPFRWLHFRAQDRGSPPTAADVNALSPQLETLDLAISGNTISAPVIVPLLPVTFNGVIALESGERGPPIGGVNPPEVFVIGNLTIVADLGAGTATSNASDFAEFVAVSNGVLASSTAIWGGFTGSLSVSGTASLSTITRCQARWPRVIVALCLSI